MNRGYEVRQALMKSAIRVVATQGIQNATTKALSIDSELSEVYIYRYFESKDDLFKQTFDSLDRELMSLMKRSLSRVNCKDTSVKEVFRSVFHDFWSFTLGDQNKCSFFIQYYYSSYYSTHSDEERKMIYQPLLELISPAFVDEGDVWIELNHMYDIVFPKLLRIIRGTMPNNDKTEESVYREVELIGAKNMRWNVNDGNK